MDVRCSRCGTEYDFDDALVSERGTTVKCTNCGHQFKVFPGGTGGVPERWIVRKSSGRELVYTSLRDLQRAIAQRQVGPQDLLSRGGGQPLRALAAIAELEPFFHAQGPANPADQVQRTLLGMSPAAQPPRGEDTVRENPPFAPVDSGVPTPHQPTPAGGFAPSRQKPPVPHGQPPSARPVPYARFDEMEPKTVPRNVAPEPPTEPAAGTMASGQFADGPHFSSAPDPMTAAFRPAHDSFSDEPLPHVVGPPRRSALRWVVFIVLVGAAAFVAVTVGIKYVKRLGAVPAASAPPEDDRVKKLLAESELDLSRGDFESAKEQLDKASVLAEKDPAVLSALARLEATRADVHWLSLRILKETGASETAEADALAKRLPRVKRTADDAALIAPSDPLVLAARIDALRIAGENNNARALVSALGSASSRPEVAYALAMLDIAEPNPAWPTIIDRLRTAAAGERAQGRARAALVYALQSSGATDEAKTELGKLDATVPPAPLLASFLEKGEAPATSGAASAAPPAAPATAPSAPAAPAGSAAPGGAAAAAPRGMDFRKLLEDASAAKRSGDLSRAEALYHAAEEQSPGNVEALAGLGDVAKARGDGASAARYYQSVIDQNPTYLPTLVALADLKWSGGERDGAIALYKRVANQAAPGTVYAQRAAQRLAEAQGGTKPTAPAPAPAPTTAPEAPAPTSDITKPSTDTPSNVDTSDLPGFK